MIESLAARAVQRVRRRLIPFLALMYFVAYVDRINVGFAALQMNTALGFSGRVYGLGAGIFFLGYFLFEIPSNLVLARVGARVWIARIAIVWGLVSIAMIFVRGPISFFVLRFLLGAAEAGFFPGIILYFTYWFPGPERARAVSLFSIASMGAGILGAPLSGVLLSMQGRAGLDGWQWLFLVEGLPAVVLGLVALAYLTDRPEAAQWLPPDEKAALVAALARDRDRDPHTHAATLRAGLLNLSVWRLAGVLFLIVTSGYGFSFFLPQIVKGLSASSDMAVGLLTAVPFLLAAIGMIVVASHSDRTGERRWHVAGSTWLAAAGLTTSAVVGVPALSFVALSFAAVGLYSATPPFWPLPTAFLRGTGAAGGIAFINAVGNLGGFVGPYVMGWMKDVSGGYAAGIGVLAACATASGVLVLTVRAQPAAIRSDIATKTRKHERT